MPHPTLLLVPGAQSTPPLYTSLAAHLRSHGLSVYIAPLQSVGLRPSNPPGLYDDAAFVASQISAILGDGAEGDVKSDVAGNVANQDQDHGKEIIVIAHSYGGVVASQAVQGLSIKERRGRGLKGGVRKIVYVAALVMEVGRALGEVLPFGREEIARGIPYQLPAPPSQGGPILFNDLDDQVLAKVYAGMFLEESTRTTSDPLTWPGYQYVETAYVKTKRDLVVPPEMQDGFVRVLRSNVLREGAEVEVIEMNAGHCPNLSRVEELGELLWGIVERGEMRRGGR